MCPHVTVFGVLGTQIHCVMQVQYIGVDSG